MSFKQRASISDAWSGFTSYALTESAGRGTCTSVARISYYCHIYFDINVGVVDAGNVLVANIGAAYREINSC